MNKYKLEDKLKDFFDQRELKPSQNAWDRIELELDNQDEDGLKDFFNERDIRPSADAWARIERALPANEKRRFIVLNPFKFRIAAAVVAALMTVAFGLYLNYDYKTAEIASVQGFELEADIKPLTNDLISNKEVIQDEVNQVENQKIESSLSSTVSKDKKFGEKNSSIAAPSELISNTVKVKDTKLSQIPDLKEVPTHNEISSVTQITIGSDEMKVQEINTVGTSDISVLSNDEDVESKKKSSARKYGIDASKLLVEAESKSSDEFLTKMVKGIQETSSVLYSVVSQRNVVREGK